MWKRGQSPFPPEMAEAGLPAPEYRQNEFMVYATIRQHGEAVTTEKTTEKVDESNLDGKELARSWQGVRRGLSNIDRA